MHLITLIDLNKITKIDNETSLFEELVIKNISNIEKVPISIYKL